MALRSDSKTPKPNLTMFKNNLSFSSALIWNSIPFEIRSANTIVFVNKYLTWMKDNKTYTRVHILPPRNKLRWLIELKCICTYVSKSRFSFKLIILHPSLSTHDIKFVFVMFAILYIRCFC